MNEEYAAVMFEVMVSDPRSVSVVNDKVEA
jgi:hypothetical protein